MSTESQPNFSYQPEHLIVNFKRHYHSHLFDINDLAERKSELMDLKKELITFMKEQALEKNPHFTKLLADIEKSINDPDFRPDSKIPPQTNAPKEQQDMMPLPFNKVDDDFEVVEYDHLAALSSDTIILRNLGVTMAETKEKKEKTRIISDFLSQVQYIKNQNDVDDIILLFLKNKEILGPLLNDDLDGYGNTVMHIIMGIRPSQSIFHISGLTFCTDAFSQLVASGGKLSLPDNKTSLNTPLHIFMQGCFYEKKQILASQIVSAPDFIAAINAKNSYDMTPLMMGFERSPDDAMRLLHAIPYEIPEKINQINFNARDKGGKTALHYAAAILFESDSGNEIEKLLLTFGKDKVDINVQDKEGLTPAMIALQRGKIDSLKVLLKQPEFDYTKKDAKGKSLLEYAEARLKDVWFIANPVDHTALSALVKTLKKGTPSSSQPENDQPPSKGMT